MTTADTQALLSRIEELEKTVVHLGSQLRAIAPAQFLKTRDAAIALGMSYESLLDQLKLAEEARRLKKPCQYKKGVHYAVLNPNSERPTYRVNVEKWRSV
jgi:hypothetical protein